MGSAPTLLTERSQGQEAQRKRPSGVRNCLCLGSGHQVWLLTGSWRGREVPLWNHPCRPAVREGRPAPNPSLATAWPPCWTLSASIRAPGPWRCCPQLPATWVSPSAGQGLPQREQAEGEGEREAPDAFFSTQSSRESQPAVGSKSLGPGHTKWGAGGGTLHRVADAWEEVIKHRGENNPM